ncbi:MAG: neutral/alkaline non-lysosomal ceramidase N-terminal domain-containing protein [Bacillota bacterium]|nr:neutral/alkaline non-lysosomal ceramidase N-terminal domain-containing protein [Bacillota bacterium]
MKKTFKSLLCITLAVIFMVSTVSIAFADKDAKTDASGASVKVGVAKVDITGPITGISTGYNSLGDLMEGLLTRLYARAFVVDDGSAPMVYVSAELVHMTESIKPGVIKALKADGYSVFSEENVMLAATHCHSSTSNTSWYALYDLINGVPGYDDESYRMIVKGITEAIETAYDTRVEGSVSLVCGETDISASNRSADAYLTNINVGDYGYEVNEDGSFSYETGLKAAQNAYNHEMAGIVFTDSKGNDIGFLNFFGSHGTSNPIDNTYVASDHKGYAALKVEEEMGDGFVAAFAQADSGDTSPNAVQEADYHDAFLRPADMDAALDMIENQIVQGSQEAEAAMNLINNAGRTPLTGKFDFNYTAVDFSNITVDLEYVGDYHMPYDDLSAGYVTTSEPCIGAGIIAGDEEGAPVDNALEGAVKHNFVWNEETGSYDRIACDFKMIDLYGLQYLFEPLWPTAMKILQSDGYDEAQMEKVVCLAVGDLMQAVQPLQIMRFGQAAIVGVPFELTYEQANRTRAVLEKTLAADGVTKVIISTHSNAYSQYVTTREEFAAQHYEGATCLFGPWSGAAMTQELDKLAQGIVSGEKAPKGDEMKQSTPLALLYTVYAIADPVADLGEYGTVLSDVEKDTYTRGEWVRAGFTGVNPRHITDLSLEDSALVDGYSYMEVQKLLNDEWVTVLTDTDPYTTFRCVKDSVLDTSYNATVGWLLKGDNWTPGTYRLVYNGVAKNELKDRISGDDYTAFTAASSPFNVEDPEYKPVQDNPFADVKDGSVYYDAVLWAYYHEPQQITAGVDDTHFAPDADCTRGQVVTFLWRAEGCPEPQGECPFTDVAESSPYYKAVIWAYENGITTGVTETAFEPNTPVTRAQFVTFLWRYENKPDTTGSIAGFADASSIAAPYQQAVAWAVEKGITTGYNDGTFRPNATCTRWAVVLFMYRDMA